MNTIAGGWIVLDAVSEPSHVIPLDDLKPHAVEHLCWCSPTDDEGILVHHSMDRREEFEEGRKAS